MHVDSSTVTFVGDHRKAGTSHRLTPNRVKRPRTLIARNVRKWPFPALLRTPSHPLTWLRALGLEPKTYGAYPCWGDPARPGGQSPAL